MLQLEKYLFRPIAAMLLLCMLCTIPVPSQAERSYPINDCVIIEKNGKYGVVDADGNILLPIDYYIPLDQFDPEEETDCIKVYQATDPEYTDIHDIGYDLEHGRLKAGFFHLGSRYFSGCVWPYVFVSNEYATVRNEESRHALIDAKTGEIILRYLYDWIDPYVTEGWVYVGLWPTEYSDEIGDWIREAAYVNLDGRILRAPDGYWFSEEYEPVVDGRVPVYEEGTGNEFFMQIDDILKLEKEPKL